jgi:serine/threonine-protein kinase
MSIEASQNTGSRSDPTPEVQRIGHYSLQQLLGRSDLSEVYIGEDIQQSQKKVAVKLLYGNWQGDEAEKFYAHVSTLSNLRHPNIMPTLDFGIEDNIAYMAMPYIPEGTLRQRHPRGTSLPLETIVQYVTQIASALQYIHDQGLVHRDIKPHNMLMNSNNTVLLSDFGTAVISHSLNPVRILAREFEGTVPYSAPEQLRGKPRRGSDQYALGVVVYEWLSGQWPFDGSFYEITHQHLFVPAPLLIDKGISCPPNIEQVILRALEKDPGDRFPTIQRFAEELRWAYKIAQARAQLPTPLTQSTGAHTQLSTSPIQSTAPQTPSVSGTTQPQQALTGKPRLQFKSPLPFMHETDNPNNKQT